MGVWKETLKVNFIYSYIFVLSFITYNEISKYNSKQLIIYFLQKVHLEQIKALNNEGLIIQRALDSVQAVQYSIR